MRKFYLALVSICVAAAQRPAPSPEMLAQQANMSPRTFARKFRDTTGATPMRWLSVERVRVAQDLLENTDKSIDHIASLSGLGSAQVLRTHFTRINQVTPHEFRRTFRANAGA